MKLHQLTIKNFRAIDEIDLNFTDYLGRPRPISLIVGPNSSGKTSILDAIHFMVKLFENPSKPDLREGLEYSCESLVRGQGNRAEINFTFSIDEEEGEKIRQVYNILGRSETTGFDSDYRNKAPIAFPSQCKLMYPNPMTDNSSLFCYGFEPENNSLKILGARGRVAEAIKRKILSGNMFEHIGGVCYLDQRRSIRLHKRVSSEESKQVSNGASSHSDVLAWMLYYYRRDITWNQEKYGESYWSRVTRLFNRICTPNMITGFESGPDIDTVILHKEDNEYNLLQMSSGEHQILGILIGLVAETAKNSIVLIDEVELHLHPAWQKLLIEILRQDAIESNNQYIFTTHSDTIIDYFHKSETINLGRLN